MRIGIIGLLQESNTFIQRRTTLEQFQSDLLLSGHEIVELFRDAHHEVGGFIQELTQPSVELVPLFFARALPFGPVSREAYDELVTRMHETVRKAVTLDGVLAAAHGATVSETQADVDGHWLSLLRSWVGAELPIVATVDPHGNLSANMVRACNALVAYQTNPHVDQRERGRAAARLLLRAVRREVRLRQAAVYLPLAVNIEKQNTDEEPCRSLFQLAQEVATRPPILSASICLGFPYADVQEMGASVIVVSDNDQAAAESQAELLGREMWRRRAQFIGDLLDLPSAMALAREASGPVGLLDMGDNVGGGAPADGTVLARALHEHRFERSLACLCDPESVQRVAVAGIGAELALRMGGKTDTRHGMPLAARVRVVGLYDGSFEDTEPRHGGFTHFDQGATAVVVTSHGLTLVLTSKRMAPFSLSQLTSCDVNPARFRYIAIKGVQAPLAAYRTVCESFIRVNTPGVTAADLCQFTYRRRRRPMFPFERATAW